MFKYLLPLLFGIQMCQASLAIGHVDLADLEALIPQIEAELDKPMTLQDDEHTMRATREYGYSFFRLREGDTSYVTPPAFLEQLGDLVCDALGHPRQKFSNFIISRYDSGFHLKYHADSAEEDVAKQGFCFDERVYGVIIEPDTTGHLNFVLGEVDGTQIRPIKNVLDLSEEVGTAFCLQGPYRHVPYYHGVSEVSNQRISVTFRCVLLGPSLRQA